MLQNCFRGDTNFCDKKDVSDIFEMFATTWWVQTWNPYIGWIPGRDHHGFTAYNRFWNWVEIKETIMTLVWMTLKLFKFL